MRLASREVRPEILAGYRRGHRWYRYIVKRQKEKSKVNVLQRHRNGRNWPARATGISEPSSGPGLRVSNSYIGRRNSVKHVAHAVRIGRSRVSASSASAPVDDRIESVCLEAAASTGGGRAIAISSETRHCVPGLHPSAKSAQS